ncbi:MAG: FtsX-like permease family protein, partial [Planctomycetota bacterium]
DGTPTVQLPSAREVIPARATNILIRAAQGYTGREAEGAAEAVYAAFAQDNDGYPTWDGWEDTYVYVWEEKPGLREFINAVRKETGLVLVLFVFISLTAVFLVGAIFWSMVSEKTKDIGILRAVGAGRVGVAWLFVRYGLAIGIVGSLVGGALAYVIVTNINPIHEWLGQTLNLYIWDPSVYYFTEIPSRVEPDKALIVLAGGVLFSALGALIPAARAASMNPVRALRFE